MLAKPFQERPEARIIDEMSCDAKNIYLKALIEIITKPMCKQIHVQVHKRCGGCVNEVPGQQSHNY